MIPNGMKTVWTSWFSDTRVLRLYNARKVDAHSAPQLYNLAREFAHEVSRIPHRDILTSTIRASIAGAISTLANFGKLFGGRDDDRNPLLARAV